VLSFIEISPLADPTEISRHWKYVLTGGHQTGAASWRLSLCPNSSFYLSMNLTFDLENLFSDPHSHDKYLAKVSFKSLH